MKGRKLFVLALVAVGISGCREAIDPGAAAGDAKLTVRADVANLTIETMSVTVTAPDIKTDLVFNLQTVNGIAQGTITVRPGSARKFSARAFDESGVETHFGETSMDVRIAGNPTVRVVLVPHAGGVPVVVVLGGVLVAVTPSSAGLRLGETVQLSATVTNGDGGVIDLPVTWATGNPAIAAVNESGLVTTLLAGEVKIVATAGGEAGAAVIVSGMQWASVVAGTNHTCGLDTGGTAYCWGYNQEGQLGDGTTTTSPSLRPVPVAGNRTFRMLTVGNSYTCGLASDGRAFCWGRNASGQIGDGTTAQRLTPTAVAGNHTFVTLSAGQEHICGLESGTAFCWGDNNTSQIYAYGDNLLDKVIEEPRAVATELSFTAIVAGALHTCGLASSATSSTAPYCWGYNGTGQAGTGAFDEFVLQPTLVVVVGGLAFQTLVAGGIHTCGLTSSGKMYCWGNNFNGEIGDGTRQNRAQPVAVVTTLTFQRLAAGHRHTCAVANGGAMCWGSNEAGQLGNGNTTTQNVPSGVAGGFVFESVALGARHTCGVTADRGVYCWGYNGTGQLGDGTQRDRLTPVRVREP